MRMVMKMTATPAITALLFCCFVFAADSQKSCDYYGATNGNLTLGLGHNVTRTEHLKWKHNNRVIFYRRPNMLVTGKNEDVDLKGQLQLINLDKSKEGSYTPEVHSDDGQQVQTHGTMTVCVLDPVPKPKVNIVCSSASVMFTCTVDQANVNFTWLHNSKPLKNKQTQTLRFKTKEVETDSFVCNVSNTVSSMTSELVKQTCIKPAFPFPEQIFGINTWILVGAGGGVVLVLIIVTIACCVRNRRKRHMQQEDEVELRLGWTNPNQQQHHHDQHNHSSDQHHHHKQHPAGHTGPRNHRTKQQGTKQQGTQQRPRAPDPLNGQPQPSPRRPPQGRKPAENVDDDQPPPLPQPRKKAPRTPRV